MFDRKQLGYIQTRQHEQIRARRNMRKHVNTVVYWSLFLLITVCVFYALYYISVNAANF